jgi:dihydroorotase
MTGLETALPVVHEVMVEPGLMTWDDVARAMSAKPARIGRVATQGRPVAAGEIANLTLFDPSARWTAEAETMETAAGHSPLGGREMRGRVQAVFYAGKPTVLDGKVV